MKTKTILSLSIFGLILFNTSVHAFHVPRKSHSSLKASLSESIIVIDEKGTPVDIPRGIFKALDNMFDAGDQKPIPLGLISVDDLHRLMSYQGPKSIPKCSLLLISQDIHKAEILDAPRIVTRNLLYQYFADLKLLNQIQPENTLKMLPKRLRPDYNCFKELWPERCNSIGQLLTEDPILFEGCYDSGILRLHNFELDSLAGLSELLEFCKIKARSITTLDVRYNKLTSLSPGILQHQCPKLSVIEADHNIITTIDTTHINQKRSLSIYAKDNPLSVEQIQLFRQLRPTFLRQLIPIQNRIYHLVPRFEKAWIIFMMVLTNMVPELVAQFNEVPPVYASIIMRGLLLSMSLGLYGMMVDGRYKDYIKTHRDVDNDRYLPFQEITLITEERDE